MKKLWRDTLFKRLFVLMWVALVVSHLAAFLAFRAALPPRDAGPPISQLPPLPSLAPPPWEQPQPFPPSSDHAAPPPGRPAQAGALWLDYAVRVLLIGVAAWFGARWLSAPMRRLSRAAHQLGESLGASDLPRLEERGGTVEVREAAEIFNRMARKLREQFDARGLFMAAISHDLRTPLTRIRLRLEQRLPDPLVEQCIADLREMDELIDGVLDALRNERAPQPLQAVDAGALVQALADDLAEQGHVLQVSARPAVVQAQPAALKRVLGNLLSNALRYGDGPVEVGVQRADDRHVHITIDDRGLGIPEAQLQAVFEPFVRLEASRSRATGGVGLGLHIARELAQRQGGTLTLSNRPEGGLRARLVLPAAR